MQGSEFGEWIKVRGKSSLPHPAIKFPHAENFEFSNFFFNSLERRESEYNIDAMF